MNRFRKVNRWIPSSVRFQTTSVIDNIENQNRLIPSSEILKSSYHLLKRSQLKNYSLSLWKLRQLPGCHTYAQPKSIEVKNLEDTRGLLMLRLFTFQKGKACWRDGLEFLNNVGQVVEQQNVSVYPK